MKTSIITFILGFLLLFAGSAWSQTAEEALRIYVQSGDRQDVATLEKVLHREFVSHYSFVGKDEVKTMARSKFVEMFRKKKFGGNQRQFETRSSVESENLVLISAELTGPELRFDGFFILQKQAGQWQLVKEFLVVRPQG